MHCRVSAGSRPFLGHRHLPSLSATRQWNDHGLEHELVSQSQKGLSAYTLFCDRDDAFCSVLAFFLASKSHARASDPFRENLRRLEEQHDETCRLLGQLDIEPRSFRRALSKAQAQALAAKLRQRLRRRCSAAISTAWSRRSWSIKTKAIVSGPKAAMAAAITAGAYQPEVPQFGKGMARSKRFELLTLRFVV